VASQELDSAFNALIQAVLERDLLSTLDCFSSGEEPAVVGSESGEMALGRTRVEDFFRRVYARSQPFRFDFPNRSWSVRGDVAWLIAEGTVVEPSAAEAKPYRLTAVFVVEDGAWKLALWSGSEPA
jgi:SnoaL-like domain